uniref:NADH-ubiquinone oxidoreductase chain 3 n=1 Tax=Vestalis melania TaxID=1199063 RepID=V9ISH7_9ODON|nr:NADH dehydrogenase subunit 3 [Vestalis melania]AFM83574.1 NADH dehydrogenase subunit 3 [Vestalis melania]
MYILMIIGAIVMMLAMLLMMVASTISTKSIIDREKSTPFECGFDPFYSARIPFSLKFFLIAVIFLIFDVEIAIILPSIVTLSVSPPDEWMVTFTVIIILLLAGLYYEWKQGALEWSN